MSRFALRVCAGLMLVAFSALSLHAQTTDPQVDIELLINRGRLPEARTALEQYKPRTRADTARRMYWQGRIALNSGGVSEGVGWLERSVAIFPKNGAAQFWLAMGYIRIALGKNKVQQAFYARRVRTGLERATEYEPRMVDARLHLIQYYLRAPFILGGSQAKARAQADTIFSFDRLSGHMARAQVAEATGDPKTAEREFLASVNEFPKAEIGYLALGGYYRRAGRYAAAVDVFQRLQVLQPDQASPHLQIGRTIAEWGQQLDRGETELQTALAGQLSNVDAAIAHYNLGLIYQKRGEEPRAREAFARAMKLDPSLGDAIAARKSVQR